MKKKRKIVKEFHYKKKTHQLQNHLTIFAPYYFEWNLQNTCNEIDKKKTGNILEKKHP